MLADFRPAVVSFHLAPESIYLKMAKDLGAKILSCATTVEEARWSKRMESTLSLPKPEAGGHRGNFLSGNMASQLGTFALCLRWCAR